MPMDPKQAKHLFLDVANNDNFICSPFHAIFGIIPHIIYIQPHPGPD